jgi:hypothetical protein
MTLTWSHCRLTSSGEGVGVPRDDGQVRVHAEHTDIDAASCGAHRLEPNRE